MTSLMRQSRTLARLSHQSRSYLRTASPRSLPVTSRILINQRRCYATEPNKDDSNTTKPSKPAPGTENLYNDKSAMSPSSGANTSHTQLHKDYVALTSQEQKDLGTLLATMKSGLAEALHPQLDQAFENIKKEGIPKEMRELLNELGTGKDMTAATASKIVNLSILMSKRSADRDIPDGMFSSNKQESTSDQQKADGAASSSSDQKSKQRSNMKGPSLPTTPKFSLDTNSILLIAFTAYLLYKTIVPGEASRDITWQEFSTTFLEKGLVDKLTVVNDDRVRVDLHRDQTSNMYPDSPASNPNFHYYFSIGSIEAFERRLDDAQKELNIPSHERIPVSYNKEVSLLNAIVGLAPVILGGVMVVFLLRSLRGGAGGGGGANGVFGMGKSRAKKFNHETDIKVKFSDVAGMDEAKLEIMEFVSFLKKPEQYERLGAKIPRGAILAGPPGTGKTLLAKATAGEAGVPFFSVSGSEFVEMFVGVGASRVRDLFANARKSTPCIIFIDEIDAIGKSRSKNSNFGGNDEREATLNQILTEMDGFNTAEQVVVLAGTNRADTLDAALMRPGRFDRHINIDKPTMDGRKQIFKVHLGKVITNEEMDHLTGRLAALTPGFSGADIANCVNEAALIAARTSATSIAMMHFEQAIERVIGGLEKKSMVLSPEDKKTVAYHEAGHAICGWYFKYADPLLKVSIIPRSSGALGYAQYLPAGDTYLMNVHQLMDRMAMTLGGRISEELHFDTVTSGASDDFNKVTRMATAMVTKWGMSKALGPLHFEDDSQQFNKPFAETTAQKIDSEVRRIVDEAYKQCKDLLEAKRKEIGIVAEELLAKEVLNRDDMVRLLGPRPFSDNKDFTKYFGGGNTEAGQAIAPRGGTMGDAAPPPMETEPGNTGGGPPAPAMYKRWSDM